VAANHRGEERMGGFVGVVEHDAAGARGAKSGCPMARCSQSWVASTVRGTGFP
jgi:hypothetical protein